MDPTLALELVWLPQNLAASGRIVLIFALAAIALSVVQRMVPRLREVIVVDVPPPADQLGIDN